MVNRKGAVRLWSALTEYDACNPVFIEGPDHVRVHDVKDKTPPQVEFILLGNAPVLSGGAL